MATKPSGGTDPHPERSEGPKRQRRMAKAGDFVSRWKGAVRAVGKSSAAAIADPARLTADRPLEGRGAVLSEGSMHPGGHDDGGPALPLAGDYAASSQKRATSILLFKHPRILLRLFQQIINALKNNLRRNHLSRKREDI